MPRAENIRNVRDAAPKPAKSNAPARSLISESRLDQKDPRISTTYDISSDGGGGSFYHTTHTTGTVHHGSAVAFVNSLDYKLNDAEAKFNRDNPTASTADKGRNGKQTPEARFLSNARDAHTAMRQTYHHLDMHHIYHLQGKYAQAAGSLGKAAQYAKMATSRASSILGKKFTENSTGREMSVADIHASLDRIHQHYRDNIAGGQSVTVEQHVEKTNKLPTAREEQRQNSRINSQKYLKAGATAPMTGRHAVNLNGAGRPANLPTPSGASNATFERIATRQQALKSHGPQPAGRELSAEEHALKAYKDVKQHGRMHPEQIAALSPQKRNGIFEAVKNEAAQTHITEQLSPAKFYRGEENPEE